MAGATFRNDHEDSPDRVTLVKQDGRRFESIRASVQRDRIFTDDPKVPIEDGDSFERALPSGVVERFVVAEAGFMQGAGGIPAHYQSRVRKETASDSLTSHRPHIVYNLTGAYAKVNIHSVDASTTVIAVNSRELFDTLRAAAQQIDAEDIARTLLEKIGAMETQVGTTGFAVRYKEFIEVAANHMTGFGPFLPALTQFLA